MRSRADGPQRLRIETLADDAVVLPTASRVGFTVEGTLRRSARVYDEFVGMAVLGLGRVL